MRSSSENQTVGLFRETFSALRDRRVQGRVLHPLSTCLTIAFLGVLAGNQGWDEIHDFAVDRAQWLSESLRLPMPNGVPSVSTLARAVSAIRPQEFAACIDTLMRSITSSLAGTVVSYDGKALRGAQRRQKEEALPAALHKAHLWSSSQQMVIAQEPMAGAPEELEGLLQILKRIDPQLLRGATITGDANQVSAKVAEAVTDAGADYTFRLKANRKAMFTSIEQGFEQVDEGTLAAKTTQHRSSNRGHGRLELRQGLCIEAKDVPKLQQRLPGVRSVLRVLNVRLVGTEETRKVHYIVSFKKASARFLMAQAREHWKVENCLHWILDVQMNEDRCAVADSNAAQNLSILRTMALMLLKRDTEFDAGIGRKQKRFARNDDYANRIISLFSR